MPIIVNTERVVKYMYMRINCQAHGKLIDQRTISSDSGQLSQTDKQMFGQNCRLCLWLKCTEMANGQLLLLTLQIINTHVYVYMYMYM